MKNHFVQVVDRARQGFKRTRSGSVSSGSRLDLIPPEIWLHIFTYLSTHTDIKALTLTCVAFRRLAQPLLFSKICTHPPPPPLVALQASKYRRRTTQRLEFFMSPHIAPAVRECSIYPPSAEDEDLPTDVVIDAIFDGFRRFPNLNTLVCRSIRLTAKRLALLHRLSLSTITLESCPSDLTDFAASALPPIPLSSVTFKYPDAPQDTPLAPLLALFLAPRHLQRLSTTSAEILPVISRSRSFTRLHHLEMPVESLTSEHLLPALARCSAIERLNLQSSADTPTPRSGIPTTLPPSSLPLLKYYRGPRNFAGLFAVGRLSTIELSVPAKAHRLLRTLRALPTTLESLSFRVEGDVPHTFFAAVHTRFPALRTLSMNDPALPTPSLHALLNACESGIQLRVLRVRVQGRDRYNLWIPPVEEASDAVDCFGRVRSTLERVYPNLATLKFMYGVEGASMVWRRIGATRQLALVTPLW